MITLEPLACSLPVIPENLSGSWHLGHELPMAIAPKSVTRETRVLSGRSQQGWRLGGQGSGRRLLRLPDRRRYKTGRRLSFVGAACPPPRAVADWPTTPGS